MTDLTLYTNPMSRGRIARWMLEEVGRPYEAVTVDYATMRDTLVALNPMGKVPVLRHGSAIVTETAAICAYLADACPEAGLAPDATSPDRAAYYRWMFFAAGPIETAITVRSLKAEVPEAMRRAVGFGSYEAVMDAIERAVSDRAYVAGDRFSAADVYFGGHMGFGLQFGTIEDRPAIRAYWKRLYARPAKQRADALDDAEIARTQQPA